MPREPPTFLTLPLELRLEIYTHLLVLPPPPPLEKRQTIYRCSYAYLPSPLKRQPQPDTPSLHPQILAVNRQTNTEATPLLYGRNTFSAHPTDPTRPPTLYHPCYPSFSFRPITTTTNLHSDQQPRHPKHHLIKKWHLRLRLDTPMPTPSPTPTPPPVPHPMDSITTTTITTTPSTHSIPTPQPNSTAIQSNNTSWSKPTITSFFSHTDSLTLHLWSNTPPFMGGIGADMLRQFESVRGVRQVKVTGMVLPGFERYIDWLRGRMMLPMSQEKGDGDEEEEEEEEEEQEYIPADEMEGKRLAGWV